jgi:hypothetical protein
MQSLFLLMAHLFLVALVYIFAYRTGYRAAQGGRERTSVKNVARSVSCLLEELDETHDGSPGAGDEKDG